MLQCPICKEMLNKETVRWVCSRGHSYDISRKNTLNLLMSQKRKNKIHGDDKGMVIARTRFLNQGLYQPLCDGILRNIPQGAHVGLDLGSGEGWYTDTIQRATGLEIVGVDVSKDAVEMAASRNHDISWVIGSSYAIPLMDASCDVCWSVFAPFDEHEVKRVLSEDGTFIQVVPRADHLYELKALIYDTVRLNDAVPYLKELTLVSEERIETMIEIHDNQTLLDLFAMTPYTYRTPQKFIQRLQGIEKICVRIACDVRKYSK